jgi:Phospholipase_D-nuclease N-terminal
MDDSSTLWLIGGVALAVIAFVGWIVTLADIFHHGALASADKTLWVMLVTFVPVLGFIVYWIAVPSIIANDTTGNASMRRAPLRIDRESDGRDEHVEHDLRK